MRTRWVVFSLGLLAAAAFLAGRHRDAPASVAAPVRPVATATAPLSEPPAPAPAAVAVPAARPDLKEQLIRADRSDLAKLEEELEARLLEDRGFATVLFDAFRLETDPVMMSFLANLLASDPPLRNSEVWQEEFLKLAERDPSFERRAAALLFLQQAESIRPVIDRMLSLAENDRELTPNALAALQGLPGQRRLDPRVAALAGRIADRDPDPTLRGIALRVEGNPDHAAPFLSDPDRTVRMQASRVTTSREALTAALKGEEDAEVREMLQYRLEELK